MQPDLNPTVLPTRRHLLGNALAAVVQVLVSGVALFALYHLLLRTVGVADLGWWSLAMAILGLARIADGGLPVAVGRISAESLVEGRLRDAACLVSTALVVVAVVMAVVLLGMTMVIDRWPVLVGLPDRARALLMPLAVVIWLAAVTAVLRAGLDGAQRSGLRNHLFAGQAVVLLILAWWLVPTRGMTGLAEAQLGASAFGLVATLVMLGWLRIGWWTRPRWSALRILLRVGVPFQIAGITSMAYEPVVKWILASWVGLESLGWYEMAARLVNQVRSLLVGAQEGLVPYVAALGRTRPDKVAEVYQESNRLNAALAAAIFPPLIAALPLISVLWAGQIVPALVGAGAILGLGWWFNALVVPAYFAGQGSGLQRWNAWAHVLMLGLLIAVGPPGAWMGGFLGVVAAWTIANVIGSMVIVWGFHRSRDLPMSAWLERRRVMRDLPAVLVAGVPVLAMDLLSDPGWSLVASGAVLPVLVVGVLWDPEMRKLLERLRR